MVCVYELIRAFRKFIWKWADPPIQNRRIRRCGGGLEHVLLQCSLHARIERRDYGPRCSSRPFVTSQHHVRALARALSPRLKCCGVVQRKPGVVDAIIEAQSVPIPVIVGGIMSTGEQAPQSDYTILAPRQHVYVLN